MPRKPRKRIRKFRKGTDWRPGRDNDEIIEIEDGDSRTYREACNRLRKAWLSFKIAKSKDDGITMYESRENIYKMHRALYLEVTDFEIYEEGVTDIWIDFTV